MRSYLKMGSYHFFFYIFPIQNLIRQTYEYITQIRYTAIKIKFTEQRSWSLRNLKIQLIFIVMHLEAEAEPDHVFNIFSILLIWNAQSWYKEAQSQFGICNPDYGWTILTTV